MWWSRSLSAKDNANTLRFFISMGPHEFTYCICSCINSCIELHILLEEELKISHVHYNKTLHCFIHLFHRSVEVKLQSWTLPFKGFEVKRNEEADHNFNAPPVWFSYAFWIHNVGCSTESFCAAIRDAPCWVIKGGIRAATPRAQVLALLESLSASFTGFTCRSFPLYTGFSK